MPENGNGPQFDCLAPPYGTIVADPPWPYRDGPLGDFNGGRLERFLPYDTMEVGDIKAMPVASLGGPGAHLYLWTTNRYLWVAREVFECWGGEVAQVLVWCKEPHGLGGGGLWANTTEFVLFGRMGMNDMGRRIRDARLSAGMTRRQLHHAVRGARRFTGLVGLWEDGARLPNEHDWARLQDVLPPLATMQRADTAGRRVDSTWHRWPRGTHSTKPRDFFDLVTHVSPGPYLDLFARSQRAGWDVWGDESEGPPTEPTLFDLEWTGTDG